MPSFDWIRAQDAAAHVQIHASAWLCYSRCRWTSITIHMTCDVVAAAAINYVQQCTITLKASQPNLCLNSWQQASSRIILVMQTWLWQRRVACVHSYCAQHREACESALPDRTLYLFGSACMFHYEPVQKCEIVGEAACTLRFIST